MSYKKEVNAETPVAGNTLKPLDVVFYMKYDKSGGNQAAEIRLYKLDGSNLPFPHSKKSPYFCRKWDKKNYNDLLKSKPSPMY